jgi:hypothetical protein
MVAAKDRLWLIKIYSFNVGLEPTTATCFAICTVLAPNRSYPKRKSQVVPSQRNRDCQNELAIIIHLKMKKGNEDYVHPEYDV